MGYETGTSLSPSDLLAKIVAHAGGQGWSITRTTGYRDGITDDQVTMHDGSASDDPYFHFLYDDTLVSASISCMPSDSDGGALALYYQHPGTPSTAGAPQVVSIGHRASAIDQGFGGPHHRYTIFSGSTSDGRYMHVVCEGDAGVFFHLCWGTIEKAGNFNGGAYMTACQVDDSIQVNWPFTWNPGGWHSTQYIRNDNLLTGGTFTTDGGTSRWTDNFGQSFLNSGLSFAWMSGGVIPWNQRTPFAPNICVSWEDLSPAVGTDDFVILGHTPNLRIVSLNGREPGEIVVIGSDNWYLFPVHTKTVEIGANAYSPTATGGTPASTSNLAGLAYLRN